MSNPCNYCKKNLFGVDNPYLLIVDPNDNSKTFPVCSTNAACVHKYADDIRVAENKLKDKIEISKSKCKTKNCGAVPIKKDGHCKQCTECVKKCRKNILHHQKCIDNIFLKCNKNYNTKFININYDEYWD